MNEKFPLPDDVPREHAAHRRAEAAAQADLNERAAERAAAARQTVIEARAMSPEVAALNDQAEQEIFGSTWAERMDRYAGTPAEAIYPAGTVLGDIRTKHEYGKTEAEREELAQRYEGQLNELIADGFELTQAKLVMDQRLDHELKVKRFTDNAHTRVRRRMGLSKSPEDSADHAAKLDLVKEQIEKEDAQALERMQEQFGKADEKLRFTVRRNGVFSQQDLERVRKGEDLYEGGKYNPAATESNLTPEQQAEFAQMEAHLAASRSEYAKITAERSRRGVFSKFARSSAYSKKQLAEVRDEYKAARDELGGAFASQMKEAGATDEELKIFALMGMSDEVQMLGSEIAVQQQLATGRVKIGKNAEGQPALVSVERRTILGKAADVFYDFWSRNSGKFWSLGTLKKMAVVAPVSVGMGMAAGALAPVTGGAGLVSAGWLAANRIAKSYAMARVGKKADDGTQARRRAAELIQQTGEKIKKAQNKAGVTAENLGSHVLTNLVDKQTERDVKRNRRRLGLAAATAIAGTVAGTFLEGAMFGADHLDHTPTPSTRPTASPSDIHDTPAPHNPETPTPPDHGPDHVDLNGAQYPWDWAHEHGYSLNELVDKAQQHGVNIERHSLPNGEYFLTVGGSDRTQDVVNALNRFA